MTRLFLLPAAAAFAALSACSAYPPPSGAPIPTEPGNPPFPSLPPDAVPASAAAQIIGSWQLAGSSQSQMQVDIDARRITARFGCLAKAWTYGFEGQRIVTTMTPIVTCRRSESPYEAEMFMQIDRADTLYHRSGRGLVFRGSGSQLVLVPR